MALLIDNDIVHKLAQLDLLTDAIPLLTEIYGDLKVLNTLRYKLCHPKPQRREKCDRKYNRIVTKRIENFLNSNEVEEISIAVEDTQLLDAMNSLESLDAGEMQLLQSLFNDTEDLLFTGDKRFLKALTKAELLQSKLIKVEGKFISFEQIIGFLIEKLSFAQIKDHYIAALNLGIALDGSLGKCFSKREQAIEPEVIENLFRYIHELKEETGNLLGDI